MIRGKPVSAQPQRIRVALVIGNFAFLYGNFTVYPWKLKQATKQVASPKFYLFDGGVARALSQRLSYPPTDAESGTLLGSDAICGGSRGCAKPLGDRVTCYGVYRGERSMSWGETRVLPLQDFLVALWNGDILPRGRIERNRS